MRSESAFLDSEAARPFAGQRVLLTGASGFLGWQVARQALAAGVELHLLGRSPGPDGATFHAADLTDHAALAAVVAKVSPAGVIHCAAPGVAPGSAGYAAMRAVAVEGTETLYAACARLAAPPRVVHVGSGFEYAPADHSVDEDWPRLPVPESYGAAKAASAQVASRFAGDLPLISLHPFHIYGAGEAVRRLGPFIIDEARRGVSIPLTGCAQQRDFLHVDDCAAWLWQGLRLAESGSEPVRFNLGSGQPITLRQFVEAVVAELHQHGIAPLCQFGALPYRTGEPMVSLPDISGWNAVCTRPARVSLAEGVADLVRAELAR